MSPVPGRLEISQAPCEINRMIARLPVHLPYSLKILHTASGRAYSQGLFWVKIWHGYTSHVLQSIINKFYSHRIDVRLPI
jgi:hypothetical protein